jgi:hypoxanthine phosphoribosyltransferase
VDKLEIYLTEGQLKTKTQELAKQINQDYAGRELLVIGILRGAFIFMADLVRHLAMPVKLDFVAVSSYGSDTKSSGVVRILKDLDESLAGRDVLLVEDIIDTGLTLKYLVKYLKSRNPASLRVCTLLDKPDRREVDFHPDYDGFIIPDYFAVGFGLDYEQYYRNLPGVYILHQDSKKGGPTSLPEVNESEGMK